MRMIAGAILILACCILLAAYWIGRVIHTPTVVGSPDAMYLLLAATLLGVFGAIIAITGLLTDRLYK
jgi:hypothetical protein